jgi:LDH2 family malate/lactate/ureidoglycolate dehydrogenase
MSKKFTYDELTAVAASILKNKLGYSEDEAAITAKVLVEADARNIPSHGVSRLAFYAKTLKADMLRPGQQPEVVWETPLSLTVDGHHGVGSYVADFAVKKMLDKAEAVGAAFATVRNSNHFGITGFWAEQAAARGMVGMGFTNTRPCGIATYGRERILGTNPIAVAIPMGDGSPDAHHMTAFMLDMATSTVAHGKVEVYDRRKKPMPSGWAVDEQGKEMTDATAFEKLFWDNPHFGGHLFLGGEGEESGGHKGYGMALLIDLLCSGLSLGSWSKWTVPTKVGEDRPQGFGIGHFFAAFKLDLFGPKDEIAKHVQAICDEVRGTEKAAGNERIYVSGEKEAEARAAAMKDGIDVDDATCAMLAEMSK